MLADHAEFDPFDFTEEEDGYPECPDCDASPTLRCPSCGRMTQRASEVEGAFDPGYDKDPDDPFDEDEDDSECIIVGNGYQIEDEDSRELAQ